MIRDWIEAYKPANEQEALYALREIMQEVALAALSRTDFFDKAAFYGGTALRIFYGLDRYSEDLDFSLLESDPDFNLEPYFPALLQEFDSLGIQVSIREKKKSNQSSIDSAFLKAETVWKEIVLEDVLKQTGIRPGKSIKIKLEVDRNPPLNFSTEERLLLRPFSFYVKCFVQSSLFAGKMHALLFRKWGKRIKGRDWYDLEWYIRKGIPLNIDHFLSRAKDSGDWKSEVISPEDILSLLEQRIASISFKNAKEDVARFVKDDKVLDIWGPAYFRELIKSLKFESETGVK